MRGRQEGKRLLPLKDAAMWQMLSRSPLRRALPTQVTVTATKQQHHQNPPGFLLPRAPVETKSHFHGDGNFHPPSWLRDQRIPANLKMNLAWPKRGQEDSAAEKHPCDLFFFNACDLGIFLPWELVLPFLSQSGNVSLGCVKWFKVSCVPAHIVGDSGKRALSCAGSQSPREPLFADVISFGVCKCASPF